MNISPSDHFAISVLHLKGKGPKLILYAKVDPLSTCSGISNIRKPIQLGVDIPKFKGDEKKPKVEYVSDFNLIEVFNSYRALAFL